MLLMEEMHLKYYNIWKAFKVYPIVLPQGKCQQKCKKKLMQDLCNFTKKWLEIIQLTYTKLSKQFKLKDVDFFFF